MEFLRLFQATQADELKSDFYTLEEQKFFPHTTITTVGFKK